MKTPFSGFARPLPLVSLGWLVCSFSALAAERADPRADSAGEASLRPAVQKRGFYDGIFLFGIMRGITIATAGSYISHEKAYDEQLKNKIATGVTQQRTVPGLDQVYFDSQYIPRDSGQIDFEYGVADHFGVGLTVFQYSIDALRQDIVPGLSYNREFVDPLPVHRNLYQGNAIMLGASFHPFSQKLMDPYISMRGGIVGFVGEAHASLDFDRYRYTNQVRNGIGTAYGAALGVNIHITQFVGIKLESSYYRQFLRSDQFSTRTLQSYHAQAGVVLNYTAVADAAEEMDRPTTYK